MLAGRGHLWLERTSRTSLAPRATWERSWCALACPRHQFRRGCCQLPSFGWNPASCLLELTHPKALPLFWCCLVFSTRLRRAARVCAALRHRQPKCGLHVHSSAPLATVLHWQAAPFGRATPASLLPGFSQPTCPTRNPWARRSSHPGPTVGGAACAWTTAARWRCAPASCIGGCSRWT